MPTPTPDEYNEARKLLSLYRQCACCHKIIPRRDAVRTDDYGQEKYWCRGDCWLKVKDD